jgi:hypothetical protein
MTHQRGGYFKYQSYSQAGVRAGVSIFSSSQVIVQVSLYARTEEC